MSENILVSLLCASVISLLGGICILWSFFCKRMALKPFVSWQKNKPFNDLFYARLAVNITTPGHLHLRAKYLLLVPLAMVLTGGYLELEREGDLLGCSILIFPNLFVYLVFYLIFEKLSQRHYQDLKHLLEKVE